MEINEHPLFANQTPQENRDFLYQTIDVFYQIKRLAAGNGTVELCNQFFGGVQVYKGIDQLAIAAGKAPHTERSGNEDYPFETSFEFCGVRFYQMRETDV